MRTNKLFSLAALTTLVLVGLALPAAAHVTVQPPEATQGTYTKLTFRVPNERPGASTVSVRVQLPPDHPFTSVSVKPKQGWTVETKKGAPPQPLESNGKPVTEVVTEITWTGGQIQPGEFDEFEVSVGKLPTDTDVLYFPAIQTYSSGEEVAWIDKATPGGEEPEHPAPELELMPNTGGGDHASADNAATTATGTEQAASTSSRTSSDSSNALAIVALIVGGIAIVLSIIAIAAGRRSSTS